MMYRTHNPRRTILFCLAWVLLSLAGCHEASPASSLPQANYVRPLSKAVTEWDEYSGRLQSPDVVNLTAQVSGTIVQAPFQEGSAVNAGDVLFVLDERPFNAELESREADILAAKAQLAQAQARFRRMEGLKGTQAISNAGSTRNG